MQPQGSSIGMKTLIVHAGTHKTATTSFQSICFKNRDQLADNGIYYPLLDFEFNDPVLARTLGGKNPSKVVQQHSYLPRFILKGNHEDTEKFLRNAYISSAQNSCSTVLVSGEDFESSLVDHSIGTTFKKIATSVGFKEIKFYITKRNSQEYFKSLYAQLASQRIPCNPITLYETIDSHGYATFSSAHGIFHYVFDLRKHAKLFETSTNIKCKVIEYETFLNQFPGACLLEHIGLSPKVIDGLQTTDTRINTSLEKGDVELLHACAYLAIPPTEDEIKKHGRLLKDLVARRRAIMNVVMSRVEKNFLRFDAQPSN